MDSHATPRPASTFATGESGPSSARRPRKPRVSEDPERSHHYPPSPQPQSTNRIILLDDDHPTNPADSFQAARGRDEGDLTNRKLGRNQQVLSQQIEELGAMMREIREELRVLRGS